MASRRSTSLLEPPRSLYTIKEDEELQIPPVRKNADVENADVDEKTRTLKTIGLDLG